MSEEKRQSVNAADDSSPGPFLARIVSHLDPYYMGTLEVELFHSSGNQNNKEGQIHQVKYMSPFAGITSVAYIDENNDYNSTQKSYGMWMVPPDVGSTVVVFFISGKGYWFGCIMDPNMNFMVPGYAATSYQVDGAEERVPVAEYNKKANDVSARDTTQIPKPVHTSQQTVFVNQGLLKDDVRGITTSSARRETPSAVFGISTPGPVDKTGPKGKVGKFEHVIPEAFISRLGGSSFVMDDGDDKFLRKTTPTDGPPEYAAVEDDETDGLKDIPHNELIRIRTRTGHQILLHNSEDLIYIGNAKGTSWIELSSDGKIDIYAEDSVSLHTKQDLNFYADRDINIEAGRNLNIKVAEEMHTHVLADQILIVDANQKIHVKAAVDITYDTTYTHHVVGDVNTLFDASYLHHVAGNVDTLYDGNFVNTVGGDFDLNIGGHNFQTSGGSNETNAGGNIVETAPAIHMNGPGAATAGEAGEASEAELPKELKTHSVPDEEGNELTQSIMRRIPTHEPWPHHENLDPEKFKPDQTDRDAEDRYEDNTDTMNFTPDYWNAYTTSIDTFTKLPPQNQEEE
jgi:hypothetical protein